MGSTLSTSRVITQHETLKYTAAACVVGVGVALALNAIPKWKKNQIEVSAKL
jgi:hypothetical protein